MSKYKREHQHKKAKNKYRLCLDKKFLDKRNLLCERNTAEWNENRFQQNKTEIKHALDDWIKQGCMEEPDSSGYRREGEWKEMVLDPLIAEHKILAELLGKDIIDYAAEYSSLTKETRACGYKPPLGTIYLGLMGNGRPVFLH